MSGLRLDPIRSEDLDDVAKVHARAFDAAAITAFGHEAIRRYYSWLLDPSHDAAVIGAWDGDRLVGFCAAGRFRGAMNGFLRANRLFLAGRILAHPRLVTSPLIRSRIKDALAITIRFARVRRRSATPSPAREKSFGVLSIATDPAARRSGVGARLLDDAEQRARANGFTRMHLSVHPDNTTAIRFYERHGWRRQLGDATWQGSMFKPL